MTAVVSVWIKKIRIGKFLCSHFNIEDRRKYAAFLVYYAYYFKKGKNATWKQKQNIYIIYGEGAVMNVSKVFCEVSR